MILHKGSFYRLSSAGWLEISDDRTEWSRVQNWDFFQRGELLALLRHLNAPLDACRVNMARWDRFHERPAERPLMRCGHRGWGSDALGNPVCARLTCGRAGRIQILQSPN